jgi:DNA (cytosine-5)-methyltransferase 1
VTAIRDIPIVDLFAGPGGLGEGFSSLRTPSGRDFRIVLSIEKDCWAHKTLQLRAFYRQFEEHAPREYYDYLAGQIERSDLFDAFKEEAQCAEREAWCAQLGDTDKGKGVDPATVDRRIVAAMGQASKWVLIGGPPCQAYSVVGRSRMLGEDRKKQRDEYTKDHRHRLYQEYLRILARHAPPVFILENVKGILSSQVNGHRTFQRILEDLQHPIRVTHGSRSADLEYRIYSLVSGTAFPDDTLDYVIRSERFGIPQRRHRVILLGVRSDISAAPGRLVPGQPRTVEDAIGRMPRLRSGLSKSRDSGGEWLSAVAAALSATWLTAAPRDVAHEIREVVRSLKLPRADRGANYMETPGQPLEPVFERDWFGDSRIEGCCNHESRAHIVGDLHRYLFAACFARLRGTSPKITDLPSALYPDHQNVLDVKPESIIFDDRFRVQIRTQAATTVVSHIAKDGHYFIHYDPSQCRSLTVREAARLQTFPDNYFFEGPRTEQYTQVGNAVPPLLARQIAGIVAELLGK